MKNELDLEFFERYKRHILIKNIGGGGQKKLSRSKVLIVGLGGIGSIVIQYLAGAGIGKLGIVDQDKVSLSNLQRQTIYKYRDIDKNKVDVAYKFIKALNKSIEVKKYNFFLNSEASAKVISEYDIILDGTDNAEARELINKECVKYKKPLIFGGVSGWEGVVSLFIHKNSACFNCVFSEQRGTSNFYDCSSEGVLGTTTSMVGTFMVAETIKFICEAGSLLNNKLLICDTLSGQTEIIHTQKKFDCKVCS